jgi:hypothetical protein
MKSRLASASVFFSPLLDSRESPSMNGRGRASKHVTRKQKRTAALMDAEACGVSSVEEAHDNDEDLPEFLDPDAASSDEDGVRMCGP